ncbi:hypothetical protein H072_4797 [Dactylellina haptotyla CBS 200.50]|uniref:Uncharacterized protein n=1 Tax=Dactylellina haptotyla (strain CBS 200.50) TaxID=1284197 RepID=S8AE64_DACHA|nr:hypothetical protein H072_4797 [Dactylellina haptotyla CBS 200.50]
MSWPVYRIVSLGGGPQDHHAIFVETEEKGPKTGHLYHVFGGLNLPAGMTFQHRPENEPEETGNFISLSKELLGSVAREDFLRVLEICERVPAPEMQFRGRKRLYPDRPLRACQEWAAEAIQALRDAEVIKSPESG